MDIRMWYDKKRNLCISAKNIIINNNSNMILKKNGYLYCRDLIAYANKDGIINGTIYSSHDVIWYPTQ